MSLAKRTEKAWHIARLWYMFRIDYPILSREVIGYCGYGEDAIVLYLTDSRKLIYDHGKGICRLVET